eukprot:412311_1
MSLLCFISTFFYLLAAITAPFFMHRSIYLDFIWRMIGLADVYSSFGCILLSYSKLDHLYRKICHFCHIGCYSICAQMYFQNNGKNAPTTSVNQVDGGA